MVSGQSAACCADAGNDGVGKEEAGPSEAADATDAKNTHEQEVSCMLTLQERVLVAYSNYVVGGLLGFIKLP